MVHVVLSGEIAAVCKATQVPGCARVVPTDHADNWQGGADVSKPSEPKSQSSADMLQAPTLRDFLLALPSRRGPKVLAMLALCTGAIDLSCAEAHYKQ